MPAAEGNRDLADRTWVHDVVVEVYELDSQLARFHSDALGAFDMHCMERLVAMFDIQTDRIYHTAHAGDRVGH